MPTQRYLAVATLPLLLLSAGCDRNGTTAATATDDDAPYERVNGRLMGDLTLLGTVAGTDLRPFTGLCAQDTPEGEYDPLCSATDSEATYQMLGLFHRSGLLESQFTDRFNRNRTLYGLYDLSASTNATDARANVNPLTNLVSHAYVNALVGQAPPECLSGSVATTCADALDGGLDSTLLNRIGENLQEWLAPLWPTDATESALTVNYADTASLNPWLEVNRLLDLSVRYDNDTERWLAEASALPVAQTCQNRQVAVVSIADLAQPQLPEGTDKLTDDEATALSDDCSAGGSAETSDLIEIVAEPGSGRAPLNTQVTITAEANGASLPFSAQLLNPRGQLIDAWTTSETELTLSSVGTFLIAVDAVVDDGSVTGGLAIQVTGSNDPDTPITWGLAGSCRTPDTPYQLTNLRNRCYEKADGTVAIPSAESTQCSALAERPDLNYGPGICSLSEQYGEPLLGICTQTGTGTRIFHYRDTITSETRQQQHDRVSRRCTETPGGAWQSML